MFQLNQICYRCMNILQTPGEPCPRCGAVNAELHNLATQLPIGCILAGKYIVGCVLGQGGFGITYVGLDLNLGAKVAIKEYYPEGFVDRDGITHATVMPAMGDKGVFFQTGRTKFVEEAKTLAHFSADEGIVSVRDFFNENGTAYIVMDFIEGKTLKSLAAERGGKLPSAEVLSFLSGIMDSMARVHEAGLLHRDISPDNIMVRSNGQVVLLDFGAARQISAMGEHSNTISVKHGFAPEEQYRTHGAQGAWTDIYALCATIYRLTTGVTPPQAMDRAMADIPLTPPNALGADFTPVQQAAIMKGLSVHGRERQQSMTELKSSLYGSKHPDPVTPPIPADHPPKHKPWLWIGVAAAVIAVIVIIVSAFGGADSSKDSKELKDASPTGGSSINVIESNETDDAPASVPDLSGGSVSQTSVNDLDVLTPGFTKGEEVYSDKNLSLTYYDYSYSSYDNTFRLEFRFKNKTDKELHLRSDWLSVNGFNFDASIYASADGGMTTEASVSINDSELAMADVLQFKEITFDCTVNDETYDNEYHTGVISMENPAAAGYQQQFKPLDIIVYESSEMRISCKPMNNANESRLNCLGLCFENKTDNELELQDDSYSLNGKEISAYLGLYTIQPKSISYATVYAYQFDVNELNISEGNDYLTFRLQVTQDYRNILWETRSFGCHLLTGEVIVDGKTLSENPFPATPVEIFSEPVAEDTDVDFEHGSWDGYTFTNRSTGISFTVPQSWTIYSEEDLEELTQSTGIKNDAFTGDLSTGNYVSIMYETAYSDDTAEKMVEDFIKETSESNETGYNSIRSAEQLLSGQKFLYVDFSDSADGSKKLSRLLVRVYGDTVLYVMISTEDGTPISDITAMFS